METFVKSSLARRAAASSSQGSATVLKSVKLDSAQNSSGASTNLAEISYTLDSLLNRLTERERLSIREENVATRLRHVCEQCLQSQAPKDLPRWQRSQETLKLVCIAADCAESIYARKERIDIPGVSLPTREYLVVHEIPATVAGDFKATAMRVHQLSSTLVVAVKGTNKTSPIDWITNANGEPVDATTFLPSLAEVKAHSGFLYVARNMAAAVLSAIQSYNEPLDRICFTGRSAGGAVASLLYMHYRLSRSLDIPIDCITFAAPPVVSIPDIAFVLAEQKISQNLDTRFLAFVAHGDLVPRADRPYIRQLLQIFSTVGDQTEVKSIQLDMPELWSAGIPVVLFDQNPDADDDDIVAVEAETGLRDFLWGNVKMHDMKVYLQMLSSLRE